MTNDILTPDDALTEPAEQKTQSIRDDELLPDKTQPSTSKSKMKTAVENLKAEIVEDDINEAENRFLVDKTQQTISISQDFGVFEDIVKDSTVSKYCDRILTWKGITVEEIKKKKDTLQGRILDKVNGRALAGELTFIMGSSGAGKTTLLNVLTGRNMDGLKIKGDVMMNGRSLSSSEMKQLSAYVQQEDVFMSSQTVSEVLHFAVKMKSPERLSTQKRASLVDQMLTTFGLKTCEHTRIGSVKEKGISRGEKKRLAFACEILTDPPILFCDEPTSGLDSFMSHQVMSCLKDLA